MEKENMEPFTPHYNTPVHAVPIPASPAAVAAALNETITTLRELEQVCFRSSRNSAAGLYFSQQRLLLMRLDIGKAPSRSDWLALAALGQRVSTKSEGKAA